jgi:hypothetical protein
MFDGAVNPVTSARASRGSDFQICRHFSRARCMRRSLLKVLGSFQGIGSDTCPTCPGHNKRAFEFENTARCIPLGDPPMPIVKLRASTILTALEEAQNELVGTAVVLTDGKAGTVDDIWLDELHGLRISIRGHDGKWPISTIKIAEGRRTSTARPSGGRQ